MTGISPTRLIGGRYVVLGALGRVAPSVWRAEDRMTGRQVAVAEVPLPVDADERRRVRERLLRAARAAGRLDQPGLVAVYDVITAGDVDHVVGELVEAPTLADRVAADGPLSECAVVPIGRQLATALHAVHAAGVVHGDVAPRSVLLGPDGRARLTGVGIAEAVDPARTARGTDRVAPELRGGGPATPESDMWALGATLHVALLGVPPAGELGEDDAPAGALGGVLVGLLRTAPVDRPTAREVAAVLDAARRSAPPVVRGTRWGWAAGGAVAGVLAGLLAGYAAAADPVPRIPTLSHGPGGDVTLPGPVAGACLARPPAPGAALTAVDCAAPHPAEVVVSLDPYAGRVTPPPDRAALDRFAAAACPAAVDPADGAELVALVPTPDAYAAGDRVVHCVRLGP